MIVGLNAGAHANPCFAGDTVRAWSEVLDTADTTHPGVGAIRLRLVATRHGAPAFALKGDGRKVPARRAARSRLLGADADLIVG